MTPDDYRYMWPALQVFGQNMVSGWKWMNGFETPKYHCKSENFI